MARVIVVGGGVIGCAVAEHLSRGRHRVLLLERDRVGSHASGAAAGLLAPHTEREGDAGQRSLALFPDLAARLELVTGIDIEYREQESITPALTADDERDLRRAAGRWLEAGEALREEPALAPQVRGAAVFEEAQVTPARLVLALARAAVAQGAELREGTPVDRLISSGGRVNGVRTAEGEIPADTVILAAGPWSPQLSSTIGIPLDVRPNRGQLVLLQPLIGPLKRMLTWRGRYLVPKPDGTVVAGSTEEDAGFDARATAEGVASLLEFAVGVVPGLRQATVERVWAALRPATESGRPIVGRAPAHPELVVATGHNRNGILLAPMTAEEVSRTIGT